MTATNDIFSIGKNQQGQLGLDSNLAHAHTPLKVNFETASRVSQISCGLDHCLIRTINNQIFACGSNAEGQLGLGLVSKEARRFIEVAILASKKIIYVAAGQASYALSVSGELYVWGKYQQKILWQPVKLLSAIKAIS